MSVWIQIGTSDTREVFSSSRLFVMGLQWVLTRKVGGRAETRENPLCGIGVPEIIGCY